VQTHEMIAVVDQRRDLDRRFGPEELTSLGFGSKEVSIPSTS
jgi:hypothetical protein